MASNPRSSLAVRSRGWCFTINNPTEAHETFIKDSFVSDYKPRYIICGREKGQQGTPHLQGYLYYDHAQSGSTVSRNLRANLTHKAPHLEPARGSGESNQRYCGKEGDLLIEHGELPTQGKPKRTPGNESGLNRALSECIKCVRRGGGWDDVLRDHLPVFCRYRSGLTEAINDILRRRPRPKPRVFVLYGPTGCGKSTWVTDSFGRDLTNIFWVSINQPGRIWMDGYRQQRCIVFDDIEITGPRPHMERCVFKRLCDKFQFQMEPKGAMTPILSEFIIFTTNDDPTEWYRNPAIEDVRKDEHYNACQTRFTSMKFENRFDPTNPNWHCGHLPHITIKKEVEDEGSRAAPIDVDADDEEIEDSSPEPELLRDSDDDDQTEVIPSQEIRRLLAVKEPEPELTLAQPPLPSDDDEPVQEKRPRRPRLWVPDYSDDDDDVPTPTPIPRRRARCKFVLDEAGCDDDDDDDDEY